MRIFAELLILEVMAIVIELRNVSKVLSNDKTLRALDFSLEEGEGFGLLGPFGSGKSQLVEILSCNQSFDYGEIYIFGLNIKDNPQQIKTSIGYHSQNAKLDPLLTVMENILFAASLFKTTRAKAMVKARELLRRLQVEDFEDRYPQTLAPGEKMRVLLARALVTDPKLLLIDEPTKDLEPDEEQLVLDFLTHLRAQGLTVILSSADIERISESCSKIAFLNKGKMVMLGSPRELIRERIGREVVEFVAPKHDIEYYLTRLGDKFTYQIFGEKIHLFIGENQDSRWALENIRSDHLVVRRATLKDVYLKVFGSTL